MSFFWGKDSIKFVAIKHIFEVSFQKYVPDITSLISQRIKRDLLSHFILHQVNDNNLLYIPDKLWDLETHKIK